jgi:hypothetical protein
MIYITKGISNNICLTLEESTTLSQPVYLFKFTWETDTNDVAPLYWIGTDISTYTYRYNLFELVEGTDVTFRIGQYIYEVYEDVTGSVPANETGLTQVEEGRMIVYGVATTIYD